ncbi:MAG: excinuclease ABC subunit A, partial [Rhodocyclaceae bacterium]|nr:excinuclease ABC subunit A [Rhodocyclaceae bacterium]
SFNSPIGACETCRGFGRVIGVDAGLVIPDTGKTLAEGAIRPWQTPSFRECQDDLARHAKKKGIPMNEPWSQLPQEVRDWVWDGDGSAREGHWYGVQGFFNWLESKAYKMHIRVLLSKYRAYTECPGCHGTRLKAESQWWHLHAGDRHLNLHEVMTLSLQDCAAFFDALANTQRTAGSALDEATTLLLTEIRSRLGFLLDVGLSYLTLDRQSRTLSGGEVQRIN